MSDDRLRQIEQKLENIDASMRGIIQSHKAEVALLKDQQEHLEYIEGLTQRCIDQGKDFWAALARMNKRIDELEE